MRFETGAKVVAGALFAACLSWSGDTPWKEPTGSLGEGPSQPGRWRLFHTHRFDPGLTSEQRDTLARLEALGYVSGSKSAPSLSGVVRHEPDKSFAGLNFYTSGHAAEAVLMDMDGQELHRWHYDFAKVWPDYPITDPESTQFWRRAYVLENGDLIAIFEGAGLIKLDKDSNLLWASTVRTHHELVLLPGGDMLALTREARLKDGVPISEDFLSLLDPQGHEKQRFSLLDAIASSPAASHLLERGPTGGDILHANAIKLLDGRFAGRFSPFRKGNVLISMAHVSALLIVDEHGKVVWTHTGDFKGQHDPTVVGDGRILLFDNGMIPWGVTGTVDLDAVGESRVIELDPETGRTAWEFHGSASSPFFSRTCGTAQRLANGNTLVTESDSGRAFEVTPDKRIVWEFYNPHRAGPQNEFVATLFELVRLPREFPTSWARASTASSAGDPRSP